MNITEVVFFLLYFCSITYSSVVIDNSPTSCPHGCICEENWKQEVISMNCAHAGFHEIPEGLPETLIGLFLNDNSITTIHIGSLKNLKNLEILDLSKNHLTRLPLGCFDGLLSLKKLFLEHNNITVNNNTIQKGVFKDLKKLEILNIFDNCDPHWTNTSYPDDAISDLMSLKELHMNGLYQKEFGPGFRKLSQLQLLNLTGEYGFGRCGIEFITEELFDNFWGLSNLIHMDFSHCEIRHVHPLAFSKMAFLKTLDFTDNIHMGIGGVENISYSLTFINVENLVLSYIYRVPDYHHFDLRAKSFRFFINTSLILLDLSANKIEYIEPDVIKYLPKSLRTFSLRNNELHDARFLANLHILENLVTFDGSYQLRYTLDRYEEGQDAGLQFLSKDDSPVELPPRLENAFGSNMKLEYPVPPLTFSENKLRVLDISSNNLRAWLGPWRGLHHLEVFNISNNGMEYIRPNSFGDMHKLTMLLMSGNHIGHTINNDRQCLTFSNQTLLEKLDLSNNVIETLPESLFISLKKLKFLDLHNNSLTDLGFHVGELKLLQILDLSYNQLTHLNVKFREGINFLAESNNVSVKLEGNLLSCSCDFLDSLKWLNANKNIISDFHKLTCLRKESVYKLTELGNILEEMKYECVANLVVIVCAASFVGISLVLAIPAIVYHQRWKIRYLYYAGPRKTNPYRQLGQQVTYCNAYISFPNSLRHFVVNKLYPELTKRGLRLACFEDTSNEMSQLRSITELIQKCDKTVVLFADDYLKNFWNTFEFHMALQEGIYNRRETVIPVVMGKLQRSVADQDILAYLRANKCIPFPGDEHEKLFWDYLEMQIKQ